ncbi:MAG: alpha/beta fold hydrolase [Phycisphaerae bacterium]|nr:alpha/beta fold hydrolase [Phycisphaerae bacterium]
MARPQHRCHYMLPLILTAVCLGCTERQTGPWNLRQLNQPPAVQWVNTSGTVRQLYYTNEPYNGHATRVFAYYAVPENHADRAPAMVLVHGGGGKAFPEWAEMWAKRGYAAIAMDLAGCGPDAKPLPDGGPGQGHEEKFTAMNQGIQAVWSYHAVAAVIRAHSLLRKLPDVDPERVGITGISWGGYLTCIAAGLDHRFKVAVPVYGCGFIYEDPTWTNPMNKLTDTERQQWIHNFDPSRYLAGCWTPIMFINGTNDVYRLDCFEKTYRLVSGPRSQRIGIRLPHSHPDGWAPKEIGLYVDSVLRNGQALPRIKRITRQGTQVQATVKSPIPVKEATLNYTTDTGGWKERKWESRPAQLDQNGQRVRVQLPSDQAITYFVNVTDERGAIVSSDIQRVPASANAK